jgi:hypothetical protein
MEDFDTSYRFSSTEIEIVHDLQIIAFTVL